VYALLSALFSCLDPLLIAPLSPKMTFTPYPRPLRGWLFKDCGPESITVLCISGGGVLSPCLRLFAIIGCPIRLFGPFGPDTWLFRVIEAAFRCCLWVVLGVWIGPTSIKMHRTPPPPWCRLYRGWVFTAAAKSLIVVLFLSGVSFYRFGQIIHYGALPIWGGGKN